MGLPRADELELSVFGPGRGECIVAHLGENSWMVIDSCLDAKGNPVALSYFELLGVNPSTDVKIVVASHWHDDHIRGMAELLKACGTAKFVCSEALSLAEFASLCEVSYATRLVKHTSGSYELAKIFKEVRPDGADVWASENKVISITNLGGVEVKVEALSPSAFVQATAKVHLASLMPQAGEPFRRFPDHSPNDLSVVVRVTYGDDAFVLGGDLEVLEDDRAGWRAILKNDLPFKKASAYKVSHHGSPNAHLDDIWTTILKPNAISVLAPYASLKVPRPRLEDRDRIKALTNNVYCTKWPPSGNSYPRSKPVERSIRESAKQLVSVDQIPGHVRIRIVAGRDPHEVALYNGATQL